MGRILRRQAGTTLIGLMIGLLVSVVGILASLSLYKTLVAVATEAKIDAMHDGQLATTLLAIQLKVQNAGFGLDTNSFNIGIREVDDEKHLYWRYKVDGVTTCEGLRRYVRTVNGVNGFALDYITAAGNTCSDDAALSTMTWQPASTISVFSKNVTDIVDFALTQQSCSPYGMDVSGNFYVLTLSGRTAANIAGVVANGNPLENTELKLCLPNIRSA